MMVPIHGSQPSAVAAPGSTQVSGWSGQVSGGWGWLMAYWLALFLALLSPLVASADAPAVGTGMANSSQSFEELQRRVTDGQFEAAYKLGKAMPERQGDPHFDFLFGVAAVNVGRTPEGVLALERHLAAIPGNDRARLDLARGYFELGDYTRARQEFEFVLQYKPPKDVRINIERYLDAMQTRDALVNRMSSRIYIEAGVGQDSNVNAGTYNTEINLPTGPVVIADTTSRAVSSNFASFAGGAQWVRRVTPPFSVFAGADFDFKNNPMATNFDTANFSGHAGFSLIAGSLLYRLTISGAVLQVDRARYRGILATTGDVQYGLGDGMMLNGVVQQAEQSHTGENSIRDSKSLTFGAGFQKAFAGPWRSALGLQVSFTNEDNLSKRLDMSRSMVSSRIFVSASPTEKLGLSLGIAQQRSDFQSPDIAFNTTRSDRLVSVDLGVNYSLSKNWVLRAEVQWSDNASNQDLYVFDRTFGLIKTRYLF